MSKKRIYAQYPYRPPERIKPFDFGIRSLRGLLQKAIVCNDEVAKLYERVYEDNVSGKVTNE